MAKLWCAQFQEVTAKIWDQRVTGGRLENDSGGSYVAVGRYSLVALNRFPQPEIPESPGSPVRGFPFEQSHRKEKARLKWPGSPLLSKAPSFWVPAPP
jgi:hypothetical protein